MTPIVGWTAAGLVLATFCCERMASLRLIAIASNLAFISYGCLAHLWPILALHAIMLPLNTWRLHGALANGDDPAMRCHSPGNRSVSASVTRAMLSLARLPRTWRERNRLRRELSTMSPGDFGDLQIPPGMIFEECRRWPWQNVSPQWRTIREWRRFVSSRSENATARLPPNQKVAADGRVGASDLLT